MLGVVPGTLFLKLGSPWIIKALLGVFIIGLGVANYKRVTGKFPVELDLHQQIRCLSDHTTPFLLNKQNPEHRLKKQSVLRVYLAAAGVAIS